MLSIVALALAAHGAAARPAIPAPVRAGKIRCGLPDPDHKTCITMARYVPRPDGGYDVVLDGLSPESGIAIHYRVPLVLRDDRLCVTLTNADLDKASFSKAGTPLKGEVLEAVRDRQREGMTPLLGHEVCARDTADDGEFLAEGYVDGERIPQLDKNVRWVDPAEGYELGPMPGGAV